MPTTKLPMVLSEFSASVGAILKLQLPAVAGGSTTILDDEGNVAGDVEVLENKLVDTSVYNKPCNMLGASPIVISPKRLGV